MEYPYKKISIHALREEGDRENLAEEAADVIFLSTPSARRATCRSVQISNLHIQFLSTPSARRATGQIRVDGRAGHISIHALREEGDEDGRREKEAGYHFYPRPPRGGRPRGRTSSGKSWKFLSTPSARRATLPLPRIAVAILVFLSTPSARRATRRKRSGREARTNFYPRPPRGGRLLCRQPPIAAAYFYPRPPRGGRLDYNGNPLSSTIFLSTPSARRATFRTEEEAKAFKFLSTPSARRATGRGLLSPRAVLISIHALREEGDCAWSGREPSRQNFYPRPPRGGRPAQKALPCRSVLFLSTPSARRATVTDGRPRSAEPNFYPRPPRGGRRPEEGSRSHMAEYFYPRPPRGGRRGADGGVFALDLFLSTPSARRATGITSPPRPTAWYFYPRPPRGGRQQHPRQPCDGCFISIHALREEGDWNGVSWRCWQRNFYPRPPRGGRPADGRVTVTCDRISIHALREEGDDAAKSYILALFEFLSTPSARRATAKTEKNISAFVSL